MTQRITEVSQHVFSSEDKMFFDANIWLFLFGPQKPNTYLVNVYSKAFSEIVKANGQIYIDILVVSEIINRWARQESAIAGYTSESFKNFRDSADFKPVAHGITVAVKIITDFCLRIESGFSMLNVDDLMYDYANGDSDFNDQIITEICKGNELTLVTHDGDFRTHEIPILTANTYLLRNS